MSGTRPELIERTYECLRGAVATLLARRLPHLGHASSLRVLLFGGGQPVLPLDADAVQLDPLRRGLPRWRLDEGRRRRSRCQRA